ncbi:MAG: SDR family oxidoreductase, partial [Rhodobacterales bacterium]|nr:SDR family oxidoreductase [Rhodobacterales bacterium]
TGAGSGIGAATARRYAAEGGRVAVLDRDHDGARAVAADCPGSVALACDVADQASVEAAVALAAAELGRIDSVLNSAGHVVIGGVEDISIADWSSILAVHATGTFLVCRAALPHLRAAGKGSIVNLASIAALVGRPRNAAYAAAKGAILALSRQMAIDLAAQAIRVNVVAPGPVRTAMTEHFAQAQGLDWDAGARAMAAGIPMGRVGSAEEVAGSVLFLLSEDASFITGGCLVPDGGLTAL